MSDKLHVEKVPTAVRAKGFTAASWDKALESYEGYCRSCLARPTRPLEPMAWIREMCAELERRLVKGRGQRRAQAWLYELKVLHGEDWLEGQLEKMRQIHAKALAPKAKSPEMFKQEHKKSLKAGASEGDRKG